MKHLLIILLLSFTWIAKAQDRPIDSTLKYLKISRKVFNTAKSKLLSLYPKAESLDLQWDYDYGWGNIPARDFMGEFSDSIADNYLVFDSTGNFIKEFIQTDSTQIRPEKIRTYVQRHYKKYRINQVTYYLDSMSKVYSVEISVHLRTNNFNAYSLTFSPTGKFLKKKKESFPMGGFL